jgi:hypothetical protein
LSFRAEGEKSSLHGAEEHQESLALVEMTTIVFSSGKISGSPVQLDPKSDFS